MRLHPGGEAALLVVVVDDVAVDLDHVGVDAVGVADDLGAVPVGEPDEAELPLVAGAVDDGQGVVEVFAGGAEVAVVEIVEVDPVGRQVGERAFEAAADQLGMVEVGERAAVVSDLGGEEDLVAGNGVPHRADQGLGVAVAVDVSGVPVGEPQLPAPHQGGAGQPVVAARPADVGPLGTVGTAVGPGAEADGRRFDPGAPEAHPPRLAGGHPFSV